MSRPTRPCMCGCSALHRCAMAAAARLPPGRHGGGSHNAHHRERTATSEPGATGRAMTPAPCSEPSIQWPLGPGARWYFPAGVYRCPASTRLSNRVHLRGEGARASWLKGRLEFGSNSRISRLKIGDAGRCAVMNHGNAHDTRFVRCRLHGGGSAAQCRRRGPLPRRSTRQRPQHPLRPLRHRAHQLRPADRRRRLGARGRQHDLDQRVLPPTSTAATSRASPSVTVTSVPPTGAPRVRCA